MNPTYAYNINKIEDRNRANELALEYVNNKEKDKQKIFDLFTGKGGLNLPIRDHQSYFEWKTIKQSIEQGQFFTPYHLAQKMVSMLGISEHETMCDPNCGAGIFFNFHKQDKCYGVEVDPVAYDIAQYLYPKAHLDNEDIYHEIYMRQNEFDYVIGNPPFNMYSEKATTRHEFDDYEDSDDIITTLSQGQFLTYVQGYLKKNGLALFIVPKTFLQEKNKYQRYVNEHFSFVGQCELDASTFAHYGVTNFNTKLVCLRAKQKGFSTWANEDKEENNKHKPILSVLPLRKEQLGVCRSTLYLIFLQKKLKLCKSFVNFILSLYIMFKNLYYHYELFKTQF